MCMDCHRCAPRYLQARRVAPGRALRGSRVGNELGGGTELRSRANASRVYKCGPKLNLRRQRQARHQGTVFFLLGDPGERRRRGRKLRARKPRDATHRGSLRVCRLPGPFELFAVSVALPWSPGPRDGTSAAPSPFVLISLRCRPPAPQPTPARTVPPRPDTWAVDGSEEDTTSSVLPQASTVPSMSTVRFSRGT